MRVLSIWAVVLLAWVNLASGARAQITLIAANSSNTGQNGSGTLLSPTSQDPIWTVASYDNSYGFGNITFGTPTLTSNSVPSTLPEPAYVVENAPGAWAPATSNSNWISATPNQAQGGMPGTFVYQFSFNSPVTGTVTFSGTAQADNGLRIVFNGVTEASFGGQLVLSTTPGWVAGTAPAGTNKTTPTGGSVYAAGSAPFNFSAPIAAGANTINFYVSNFDDAAYTGDEEGLDVTNFAITAVPEPHNTAACLLGAVLGLVLLRRGWRFLRA